jgi:hypothetical protein
MVSTAMFTHAATAMRSNTLNPDTDTDTAMPLQFPARRFWFCMAAAAWAAACWTAAPVQAATPGKALRIPPSSIIVSVRRAYVFGQGRDRYCSPEISVFNQANKSVSIVMIAAEYTQTLNGVSRKVGNTHTRFTIDPGDTVVTGFYRLSTDSCENITARASVSVCLWRDRSECHDRVVFSDSGQIPMQDIDSDANQ